MNEKNIAFLALIIVALLSFSWILFAGHATNTNDFLFHFNKVYSNCFEGYNLQDCAEYPNLFHKTIKPFLPSHESIENQHLNFYSLGLFLIFLLFPVFIAFAFGSISVLVFFATIFPFHSINTFTLPYFLLVFLFSYYLKIRKHLPLFFLTGFLLHPNGAPLFLLVGLAEFINKICPELPFERFYFPAIFLEKKPFSFEFLLINFNFAIIIQAFKKFKTFHFTIFIPLLIYSILFDVRAIWFSLPLILECFSEAFKESDHKIAWIALLLFLIAFNAVVGYLHSITLVNECDVSEALKQAFCTWKD